MDKEHIAVYVPAELAKRVDVVARDEMRSRTNTVTWLLSQALQRREPAAGEVVHESVEAG
jgi:hypothetical protein